MKSIELKIRAIVADLLGQPRPDSYWQARQREDEAVRQLLAIVETHWPPNSGIDESGVTLALLPSRAHCRCCCRCRLEDDHAA